MTSCSADTGWHNPGQRHPKGINFSTHEAQETTRLMKWVRFRCSPTNTKTRLLSLILAIATFTFGQKPSDPRSTSRRRAQPGPSHCTDHALAALRSIPKLNYKCTEDPDDAIQKSPRRHRTLKAYLSKLESAVGPRFWAASAGDVNACATGNKARASTPEEQREIDSNPEVLGDESTRLILLLDPCVKYSYITQN